LKERVTEAATKTSDRSTPENSPGTARDSPPVTIDGIVTTVPVTVLDEAYAHLVDLHQHDKIRYGDFGKTAIKYGLTKRQEAALRRRMSRHYHQKACHNFGGAVDRSQSPASPKKPSPGIRDPLINLHGKLFYKCRMDPALVALLPWHGKGGRGWRGFRLPNLTLMCFKDGRMEAYDKGSGWREALVVELRRCGWSDESIGLMFDNFRATGQELHIAQRTPGVLMGVEQARLGGLLVEKTDHTPWWNGTTEHVFRLEHYFEELHHEVKALPHTLGLVMGGMPITTVMSNLMVMMDRVSQRIARLEELEARRHD